MKVVRTTKGGWTHRVYVRPESWKEKIALYLRGYRKARMLVPLQWYSKERWRW